MERPILEGDVFAQFAKEWKLKNGNKNKNEEKNKRLELPI